MNEAALRCLCASPRGHYGYVFLGTHKVTAKLVAIKRIDRTKCTPFRIQEEVGVTNAMCPGGFDTSPSFRDRALLSLTCGVTVL